MNAVSNNRQNSRGDGVKSKAVTLAIKTNAQLPQIMPNIALKLGICFVLIRV